MIRPNFARRALLAGCFSLLGSVVPVRSAATWEGSITPLLPLPSAEIRPAHAQYNFGWNGVTAATADLRLTRTAEGRFRLEASGGTTGLARTLWKFDLKNTSVSDARRFRPLEVHEIENARKKILDTKISFAPDKVISVRDERAGSDFKTKTRTFEFPDVLSLNSAMLYLRARPLTDGSVQRVVVYPATAPYLCTVTVLGRDHITGPTGSYNAVKADVQLDKIGKEHELLPHKKFKRATVWLTNDPDHMILRIEAQIFVGSVFAELQSIQFEDGKP